MNTNTISALASDLSKMKINELADIITRDWKNVNFAAKPYLEAMSSIVNIEDNFGEDKGRNVVMYFLINAQTWKGQVAREVKAELKKRVKK
jgi:hypothetical protein